MSAEPPLAAKDRRAITEAHRTGAWIPSNQKDETAERALYRGHEQVALDHGADDRGRSADESPLLIGGERDRIGDALRERVAVTHEKEQQVQHD